MSRPVNKSELLSLSRNNFDVLNSYINSLSDEKQHQEFTPGNMCRNIRDVLAHLHHWHLLMINWYETGMAGKKPDIPAKGYTWKTTSLLNQTIKEKYENATLVEIRFLMNESHENIMDLINKHSNEELFDKNRYSWTVSVSLGSYFTDVTSSHYDWALKLIKKGLKVEDDKKVSSF